MKILLVCALVLLSTSPALAQMPSGSEQQAFSTRTVQPSPSPALVQALELAVPAPEDKGPDGRVVDIGIPARLRADQAALAAMNALPAEIFQNDADWAWMMVEKGNALWAMGQHGQARAIFKAALDAPLTRLQRQQVGQMLNRLGDKGQRMMCPSLHRRASTGPSKPAYPSAAVRRGVEGWVNLVIDIDADGSASQVEVTSSSMQVFESPAVAWLLKQQWEADGAPLSAACSTAAPVHFVMGKKDARFKISEVPKPSDFHFESIGAYRRVRSEAYQRALQDQRALAANASPASSPSAITPAAP